ncbi:MAG: hypothetical protein U1F81_22025 [Verrucomicrobiaceae bacterium]
MFLQDPATPSERIPHPIRVQIVQLLRGAYHTVDSIMRDHPIVHEFGHGGLARGILKYIVANNIFCKAVANGVLPGRAVMKPAGNGGAEYMEYVYDRIGITLSRTQNPWDIPRPSAFRVNSAYSNQSVFEFDQLPGVTEETLVDASLVLVHGDKDLNFVRLILCSVENEKLVALHKSQNLVMLSDQAAHVSDYVPEDDVDEIVVTLRDEFRNQSNLQAG